MREAAKPIGHDERDRVFEALAGRHLALCVSGGIDSMALMHLACDWMLSHWPERIASGWLTVLTVDHGLREAATAEAKFVCREAGVLGLPHHTLVWEGRKPNTRVQEAARDARRRLLAEFVGRTASNETQPTLVMAHHADDQAETFLMRLARGSGIDGLVGMQPIDQISLAVTADGRLLSPVSLARPLLSVSRERLQATLSAYGGRHIDDPSNSDDRFERVRTRKALGELGKLGVDVDAIALSMRRLADARGFVSGERVKALAFTNCSADERLNFRNGLFGTCGFRRFATPENRFAGVRILRALLEAFGGSAREPSLADVEALFDWVLVSPPSARTLGGCKIEVLGGDAQQIRVFREGKGEGLPSTRLVHGEYTLWDGLRFKVDVSEPAVSGCVVEPLGAVGWAELRRQVPELETLKMPAAAMGTMPVVRRKQALWACPVLHHYLMNLQATNRQIVGAWRRQSFSGLKGFKIHHFQPFE
ncbi:MAG: tRNA lysidine(34) synthetase TilS [Pseudomonadota bacterium]